MTPRLLFFVPSLGMGGAERHTVELRARLQEKGFDAVLVVYGRRRSPSIVSHPGAADAVMLDLKGMSEVSSWTAAWRELRRQDADLIFAVNQTPLIVSVLTRMFGGTRSKIACIFHSTALPKGELRLLPLFRWALRKADMFICVSASQLAHWSEAGLTCKRTVVVRNGIDLQKFVPDGVQRARVRSAYGFADGDLVLGLVATFRPEKNHEALVQAVADLRKDGVPAKAILVGDGPTRQTVEDYAAALRVKQHVVFAGEQADVKSFIAASDVGILCSRTETLPLAALEFTAMGVPMVMSRLGGTAEIVSDGENGLLFDLDQPHDLAKQLTKLTSKEVRMQMGSRAREAAQQFSFERMVESYIALAMELHGSG